MEELTEGEAQGPRHEVTDNAGRNTSRRTVSTGNSSIEQLAAVG